MSGLSMSNKSCSLLARFAHQSTCSDNELHTYLANEEHIFPDVSFHSLEVDPGGGHYVIHWDYHFSSMP